MIENSCWTFSPQNTSIFWAYIRQLPL